MSISFLVNQSVKLVSSGLYIVPIYSTCGPEKHLPMMNPHLTSVVKSVLEVQVACIILELVQGCMHDFEISPVL